MGGGHMEEVQIGGCHTGGMDSQGLTVLAARGAGVVFQEPAGLSQAPV